MIKILISIALGLIATFAFWALLVLVFVFFGIERPAILWFGTWVLWPTFAYAIFKKLNKNKVLKPTSSSRYCNHCGKKVDESSKFCEHCGSNLNLKP